MAKKELFGGVEMIVEQRSALCCVNIWSRSESQEVWGHLHESILNKITDMHHNMKIKDLIMSRIFRRALV